MFLFCCFVAGASPLGISRRLSGLGTSAPGWHNINVMNHYGTPCDSLRVCSCTLTCCVAVFNVRVWMWMCCYGISYIILYLQLYPSRPLPASSRHCLIYLCDLHCFKQKNVYSGIRAAMFFLLSPNILQSPYRTSYSSVPLLV